MWQKVKSIFTKLISKFKINYTDLKFWTWNRQKIKEFITNYFLNEKVRLEEEDRLYHHRYNRIIFFAAIIAFITILSDYYFDYEDQVDIRYSLVILGCLFVAYCFYDNENETEKLSSDDKKDK